MNPFPAPIHFDNHGMVEGKRTIILTEDFYAITSLGIIKSCKGAISDGCSVPRICHSIVGHPFDSFLEATVIHDELYSPRNTEYSRAEADLILKELMWNCGEPLWKLVSFYSALRLFGGKNFKGKPSFL